MHEDGEARFWASVLDRGLAGGEPDDPWWAHGQTLPAPARWAAGWLPGRQQAQHERPRPPPRLHPAKTSPDPQHQLIEHAQPAAGVYAVASSHRRIARLHIGPADL